MVNHKATHRYSGLLGLMSRDATGQEDKKDSEMKFPKSSDFRQVRLKFPKTPFHGNYKTALVRDADLADK